MTASGLMRINSGRDHTAAGLMSAPLLLVGSRALATAGLWVCTWALAADPPVALSVRLQAARQTASSAQPCLRIQPFYWEIGAAQGPLVGATQGEQGPQRDTPMPVASASKWIYAAYVVERRKGLLTAQDLAFLNFRSGYTRFRTCLPWQTVEACQFSRINGHGEQDPKTVGVFDYNGGHMQKHAMLMGLGADDKNELAADIRAGLSALGQDWHWQYAQAQLAGGGVSSAADYARFLQGLIRSELALGNLLGHDPVCTNPQQCPDAALHTPIPSQESWHYAIGHWVEDDPRVGDGAFSSPGAFGFYPWIDASKQTYGIVARHVRAGLLGSDADHRPYLESVACGRSIRAAWRTGQAQP